jgi:nucleoside diphosphate kinase
MKRNVSAVRLIVATRSSDPPASGKIINEMSVSVASGTPYTITITTAATTATTTTTTTTVTTTATTTTITNDYDDDNNNNITHNTESTAV